MATDKKSDYYTSTHSYTDNDGLYRNFDFVDHDVKTKIRTGTIDGEKVKRELREYRDTLIEKILSIPAIYCSIVDISFTNRGDVNTVSWNERMLKDEGVDLNKLISIYTLASNKQNIQ